MLPLQAVTNRRRAAAAVPAVLAAAALAAGCGADDEPRQVASTTVATTSGDLPGATTASGGARTATAPSDRRTTSTPSTAGRTATTPPRGGRTATTPSRGGRTATAPRGTPPPPPPPTAATTKTVKVPPSRAKLGPTQRFSGTGDRDLGELELERTAVVRWTVSGASFELRDGSGKLKISGTEETGQSFAAAGTYRSVTVKASGRWTLSFTALGS